MVTYRPVTAEFGVRISHGPQLKIKTMNVDNLDGMFKPKGLECPNCKSKNLRPYDPPTVPLFIDEDEITEDVFYLFECEDCGYHF